MTYAVPVVHPDGDVTLTVESPPAWATVEGLELTLAPGDEDVGTHELKLVASFGQQTSEASLTVLVGERPVIEGSLSIDSGNDYTRSRLVELLLTLVPSKAGWPESVRFSTDGATFGEPKPFAPILSFELPDQQGEHTVWAEVKDAFGATGRFSASIVLDSVGPEGLVEIGDGTLWAAAPEVAVQWSFDEPEGSFDRVCFRAMGNPPSCHDAPSGETLLPLTDANGRHVVLVDARDLAGNTFGAERVVWLDRERPQVSLTIGDGDPHTPTRAITLRIQASDAFSGVDSMRISEDDGSTWSDWEAYAPTRNWTLSSDPGDRTLRVEVRDLAGNVSAAEAAVLYDPSLPTLSLKLVDGQGGTREALVTFEYAATADEAVSEVCLHEQGGAVDCSLPAGTGKTKRWILEGDDGERLFTLSARTASGVRGSITRAFWLDRQAPALKALTVNEGNPYTREAKVPVEIELEGEGPDASPITRFCVVDAGTPACVPYVQPFLLTTPVPEGQHDMQAYVVDAGGNESEPKPFVVHVDRTPPVISLVAVNGKAVGELHTRHRDLLVKVGAFDPQGTPFDLNFGLEEAWTPATAGENVHPIELPDADGEHPLAVKARDRAGNVTEAPVIDVVLDRVAPTGTFTVADAADWLRTASLTLSLQADDDRGVAEYCAVLGEEDPEDDSPCWQTYQGVQPHTLHLDPGGPQGDLTLTVRYRDRAGNRSAPSSVPIRVDLDPPVFSDNAFVVAEAKHRSIRLEWPEADDANGIDTYRIRLVYENGHVDHAVPGSSTELELTDVSNNIAYTVSVTAFDGSGAEATCCETTLTPRFPFEFAQRLPTSALLNGVAHGTEFIAVGEAGVLLRSADGTHFTRGDSGVDVDLEAVAMSGAWGVAVGDGVVLVTSDGGHHWHPEPSLPTGMFTDVAWVGSRDEGDFHGQVFMAVGENGVFRGQLRAFDTHATWTQVSSRPARGVAVCPPGTCGNDAVVVVTLEHEPLESPALRLLYSADGGRSTTVISTSVTRPGGPITWSNLPQPGFYVATTDAASDRFDVVYRLNAQASSPQEVTSLGGVNARALRSLEDGVLLVGGSPNQDTLVTLTATGATRRKSPAGGSSLNGALALPGGGYIAVGAVGTILRNDGNLGLAPELLSSGPIGYVSKLDIAENTVWSLGQHGLFIGLHSDPEMHFVDARVGTGLSAPADSLVYFTDVGKLYRYTEANGIESVTLNPETTIRGVSCRSTDHCYAVGEEFSVYELDPLTGEFNRIHFEGNGIFYDVADCFSTGGFAVGTNQSGAFIVEGAVNFMGGDIGSGLVYGVDCYNVLADSTLVIVMTTSEGIYTFNLASGLHLTLEENMSSGDAAWDESTGTWWAAGRAGLFRSADGMEWTRVPLPYSGEPSLRTVTARNGTVWVGGNDGRVIMSTTNGE